MSSMWRPWRPPTGSSSACRASPTPSPSPAGWDCLRRSLTRQPPASMPRISGLRTCSPSWTGSASRWRRRRMRPGGCAGRWRSRPRRPGSTGKSWRRRRPRRWRRPRPRHGPSFRRPGTPPTGSLQSSTRCAAARRRRPTGWSRTSAGPTCAGSSTRRRTLWGPGRSCPHRPPPARPRRGTRWSW